MFCQRTKLNMTLIMRKNGSLQGQNGSNEKPAQYCTDRTFTDARIRTNELERVLRKNREAWKRRKRRRCGWWWWLRRMSWYYERV